MKLFVQRIKVCIRLASTLRLLWRKGCIEPADLLKIRKRGNGLASTFLIGNKVVVKLRNEMASSGNRALYNGKFDGLFAYAEDAARFRNEYDMYMWLSVKGMSAAPVLLTEDALVTSYLTTNGALIEEGALSPARISMIFDVMERMHKDGLFHGDLNLDNFILSSERLFVIDFESSRRIAANERQTLPALDLIIFLGKLQRFYAGAFEKSLGDLRTAIKQRKLDTSEAAEMAQKYLPEDIVTVLFA